MSHLITFKLQAVFAGHPPPVDAPCHPNDPINTCRHLLTPPTFIDVPAEAFQTC